jgi:16S rRNA (cytidine1402-2'-O)-methyltransferase
MIYITPTPIGNLEDITLRGIKVLSKAKVILCEDGKITSKLLSLLNIENKPKYINLVRNNQFNESGIRLALSEIYGVAMLQNLKMAAVSPQTIKAEVDKLPLEGEVGLGLPNKVSPRQDELATLADWGYEKDEFTNTLTNLNNNQFFQTSNSTNLDFDQNVIAIVTDAGTPGISDPAFEIIRLLKELNLDYTVLPGATACIPAIVSSNLVSKEFVFLGFLPLKKGRQTIWKEIAASKYPTVIYESCHRISKLVEEMQTNLKPDAQISISQELSKKHENTWIGKVKQLNRCQIKDKGEFVIVIRN